MKATIPLYSSVSAASPKFSKGNRVVVRAGKNDWYVGIVTRAGAKLYIQFDDGATSTVDPEDFKHVHLMSLKAGLKKYKKPLLDEEAKALFVAPQAKTSAPVKIKVPINKPKKADVGEEEVTSEEAVLMQKIGAPQEFDKIGDNRTLKIHYLHKAYERANAKLFKGKLKPCNMRLSKDTGTRFRRRGAWFPGRRLITISPRLFFAKEEHVLTTLVHEMCHQWVSEVDGIIPTTEGGHGPDWQTIMRKIGLTPSRYSKYDNETFMTAEEKEENTRLKTAKEAAHKEADQKGLKKPYYLVPMMPAQWNDPKTSVWHKGLIVDRHDQAGKRWIFITDPHSRTWGIIPTEYFYELPESEKAKYTSDEFKSRAREIINYKSKKNESRQVARAIRNMYRTMF